MAYQRAQTLLAGLLARELTQATGLSEADYQVLVSLTDAPDGRLRSIELRCVLSWEKSRLSHQVRRMTSRGLITKRACAEDGRSSDIVLTDAGRDAAQRASCVRARSVRRHVIGPLGRGRLGELAEISASLEAAMRDVMREDPEAGAALATERHV